jgi:hypothetical protein
LLLPSTPVLNKKEATVYDRTTGEIAANSLSGSQIAPSIKKAENK